MRPMSDDNFPCIAFNVSEGVVDGASGSVIRVFPLKHIQRSDPLSWRDPPPVMR